MNKWLFVKHLMLPCLLFCPVALAASPIYHWVDDNGVHHYTESAPPSSTGDVSTVTVDDTRSPDYDPEQDIYGVAEQQQRMLALRQEREEKREKRREEEQRPARQPPVVVVQQNGSPYATSGWWGYPSYPNRPGRPPWKPGKPVKPVQPIEPEVRPPSHPFKPPGRR